MNQFGVLFERNFVYYSGENDVCISGVVGSASHSASNRIALVGGSS